MSESLSTDEIEQEARPAQSLPSPDIRVSMRKLIDLVPYWRNPRRIGDEAVNAVAESIDRFGYQQPIVVDTDDVIVMGHTRWGALRRLGVEEVPVVVADKLTPAQIKQLRTIDNRTSEFTTWDFDKLVGELGELDAILVRQFFPELAEQGLEESDTIDVVLGTEDDQIAKLAAESEAKNTVTVAEFVCPQCFHGWTMDVTPKDIEKGRLELK